MTNYKINKGFIVQKMGKDLVIFDGESSVLYTFNETAAFIFRKLKLQSTEEKIVKSMVAKYKIGEKEAQKDLKKLVRDLLAKKVIS